MATAFGGPQTPGSALAPGNKYFSDSEWRGMLADDASALKSIATVLAAVITLGFLAIAGTVWLVI